MSYYKVLGLENEPFSTSPDPKFFYPSISHNSALNRVEIAIRLKRGLNVILGDVGTGKTTLSRMLLQVFKDEQDYIFHMLLDPSFKSEFQFLSSLCKMFGAKPTFRSTLDCKDALEKYLFHKGVDEGKTTVLIIDEGQKLTPTYLEILRILLNYETNEFKLLQLVILGQMELLPRIRKIKNFIDRINLKYIINPFDENETKEMINFRLKQAGYNGSDPIFTEEAKRLIYQQTQGYPRRIALLCHDAMEAIIMQGKSLVDELIVERLLTQQVR